jgi:hypothetical protein
MLLIDHNLTRLGPIEDHGWPAVAKGSIGQLGPVLSEFIARVLPAGLEYAIDNRGKADTTTTD